ncbi:MAG: putative spermidine/putrescine transport system ATP-binding protein [Natronomonas sp.]|jgi:putative spermidine/putrescine transport system ATP-binding protein|uniref:ABC transporter ATP-binding protein n=1 Tax=Natronomonas sp. TaxID=2184060 RepID=UPI00398980EF
MADVTLDAVTKQFDTTLAVDNVSLTIDDGEIMGIVGPSGCGKTSTLRLVAGFETPTDGAIKYDGEDVTHVPPENRNVGLVFQSYALFNNMSVLGNVTFGPKMHGVGTEERRRRAHELLDLLDIGDLADRDPQTLSGGQQQRVGLARALAIEPRILLLDEPMAGLDAKLKQSLRTELGELLEELAVTTLYVTHDQEQALSMCDRIAVMNDGVIEQVGSPSDIYESPGNEFVADFIGTTTLLSGSVRDGHISFDFGELEAPGLPQGDTVTLAVRPDDFTVGAGPIAATVRNVLYLGETIHALAELDDGTEVTAELDRHTHDIAPGDQIKLNIDPGAPHVVDQ